MALAGSGGCSGQAVPGTAASDRRALRGGRPWWWESPSPLAGQGSGVSYSPAILSDTHLPSPFCLLGTGWTVCISKIPFWPVCVPASAKSRLEPRSDEIWLSPEKVQEGSRG